MLEEIRRPDGSVFTPSERSSEFDGKDLTAITDALNKNPLYNGTIGFSSKAPIQPPKAIPSKIDDTNGLLREQNDEIRSLKVQLKQLNDKTSSQTQQIKYLKRDLKEEREKRTEVENKLSQKDWKNFLLNIIACVVGGVIGVIIQKTFGLI